MTNTKSKTREKKEQRQATINLLRKIAVELFEQQKVWPTEALDSAMIEQWETTTGEKVDNYGDTGSGRNRFLNLVDWVKAYFTEQHSTHKVIVGGEEYRVWIASIGHVHGESLVARSHLVRVVDELGVLAFGESKTNGERFYKI